MEGNDGEDETKREHHDNNRVDLEALRLIGVELQHGRRRSSGTDGSCGGGSLSGLGLLTVSVVLSPVLVKNWDVILHHRTCDHRRRTDVLESRIDRARATVVECGEQHVSYQRNG